MLAAVLAVILAIAIIVTPFELWEDNKADEILVVQAPFSGIFTWHFTAGVKTQNFGWIKEYKKRGIYSFDTERWEEFKDQKGQPYKKLVCCGIEVRFNDGAHGMILGSIQFDMPMDSKYMTLIHTKYGSQQAVQKQIIETVTGKAVYFAGPLMSSRESYAEKRNDLIHYIEDQIQHGVYKTRQRETRVKDPLSGQEKTVTVTEIVIGKDGKPERQEESVLSEFGIRAFNLAIKRLPYDHDVEAQIQQQQVIAMDVQTSQADAKKAEQRTFTVIEQGKANAAEAEWAQKTINAKEVALAEKDKQVAGLKALGAEHYKRQQILEGEGEAAKKRLVMEADGGLELKAKAAVDIARVQAEALKGAKLVPDIVMGGGGGNMNAATAATDFMNIMTADATRRLGLNLGIGGAEKTAGQGTNAPSPAAAAPVGAGRGAGR
ncbi:MAG: SPFH domain-containing protein [Candidatus Omnitrophota bacterium]|nr:SPFH domain-containing protein [Candidatus Omnitrophota bacterium]